MFRKLGIGFTALALLVPGIASALGVGDYELRSYLNQPLEMEVELLDTDDLSQEEILVSLASQNDFDSAGVERLYFLNDLQFEVQLAGDGTGTVRITSNQPVREPYLNFLVELMWPSGRLLREYTILLDPPTYADGDTGSVAPAQPEPQQTQPRQMEAPQPEPAPAPRQAPAPAVTTAPAEPAQREQYVVQASDTMWRIALNNRPVQSISVQQMLIAIQALNQDAFIDGNVNLVREGTVLRMPTQEEVRRISTRDALREIADQNREWRSRLDRLGISVPSRAQVDATGRGATGVSGRGRDAGQVTLVTPEAGATGEGQARGQDGAGADSNPALENELAIRNENLDRLQRTNAELESRLDALEEQMRTSEQLLELRNQQIAELQEQLRRLGVNEADMPEMMETPAETPAEDTGTDATPTDRSEETPDETAAPDASAEDPTQSAPAADGTAGAEATTPDSQPAQDGAANGETSAESAPVTRPVAPVPAPAPAPAGPLGFLRDNLMLVAGGAALLLMLLAALLVIRRRRAEQDDEGEFDEDYAGDDDDFLPPTHDDDADDLLADFGDESEPDQPVDDQREAGQDPLEEVDYYTAYGRHAEAVTFLRHEIDKAPERTDLKIRLLEVLAEMHDADAFEKEAEAWAGDEEIAARVAELRPALAGAAAGAATASAQAAPQDEENEPSLDDLEFDLSSDFGSDSGGDQDDDLPVVADESRTEEVASAPALEDEELDFDFDLSEESVASDTGGEEEIELEAASEEDADDLAASLDLDAAMDLDGGEAADEEVDFGDLSLEDSSDEFAEVAEEPASDELDLSLDDLELDDSSETAAEPLAEEESPTDLSLDESDEDLDLSLDDFGSDLSLDDETATPSAQPDEGLALSSDDDLDLDTDLDLASLEDETSASATTAPTESAAPASAAAPEADDLALGEDDDFDFLGDADENATKLDLARAYIDMGDADGARDILNEVIAEGSSEQQQEAKDLLAQVS